MKKEKYLSLVVLILLCVHCFADKTKSKSQLTYSPGLFDHLGKNIVDSFNGENLYFHGASIASTYIMTESGADSEIQDYFQEKNPFGQTTADIAFITGNFWHFIPGLIIYWYGKSNNSIEIAGAGAAGTQAVFSTFLITTAQKMISARKGPIKKDNSGFLFGSEKEEHGTDDTNDFSFAPWNYFSERRFYWPSGHTATAFSFVSALTAYYPEKPLIPLMGYPLALFMGVSMIEGDFHWGSDVIAGALIGHVIGWTIGKDYRSRVDGQMKDSNDKVSLLIYPMLSKKYGGLLARFKF